MKKYRNYIIVGIITALTLYGALYLANRYVRQKQYEDEQNSTLGYLSEIKADEFDNYIVENHDIMVYISDSEIDNSELQKKVVKLIRKNSYDKDVIYLNINSLDESFYENLAEKYFSESLENVNLLSDSLLIIKEGKITAITNVTNDNVSELKKFIESYFYGDK